MPQRSFLVPRREKQVCRPHFGATVPQKQFEVPPVGSVDCGQRFPEELARRVRGAVEVHKVRAHHRRRLKVAHENAHTNAHRNDHTPPRRPRIVPAVCLFMRWVPIITF